MSAMVQALLMQGQMPVSLLHNFEIAGGGGTYRDDDSLYAHARTDVSGTTPSVISGATNFKFGSQALSTGAHYFGPSTPLNLSTGDWTIDLWLRGLSQNNSCVFAFAKDNTYPTMPDTDIQVRMFYSSGNIIEFIVYFTDTSVAYLGGWPDSVWNNVGAAFNLFTCCRSGNTIRAFYNGSQTAGSPSVATSYDMTGKSINNPSPLLCTVGGLAPGWGVNQASGTKHFDALRVVKKALYTADFTAPVVAPGQYA